MQVASCDRCQRMNQKLTKSHGVLHPVPVKPQVWYQIGIDLVGPLATTPRGNKYILTIINYFSKWAEAYPNRDKSANSVAESLYDECYFEIACCI